MSDNDGVYGQAKGQQGSLLFPTLCVAHNQCSREAGARIDWYCCWSSRSVSSTYEWSSFLENEHQCACRGVAKKQVLQRQEQIYGRRLRCSETLKDGRWPQVYCGAFSKRKATNCIFVGWSQPWAVVWMVENSFEVVDLGLKFFIRQDPEFQQGLRGLFMSA